MKTQHILDKLAAIGEEIKQASIRAKNVRLEAIGPFLDDLAASGAVSVITIYGYTPGFNDGEPCEHTSDYFVNIADHTSDEINVGNLDLSEVYEQLEGSLWRPTEEDTIKNREICASLGHVFDRPNSDIMDAIANIIYATEEENHGTDYYVTYLLVDGKFVREEGHYDCGY